MKHRRGHIPKPQTLPTPFPCWYSTARRLACSKIGAMYDLHTLGWHSFQHLCLTILREVMGQAVESFLDGNDGGRDGAFSGTWKPSVNESLAGRFVIQCKHTSRPAYVLQLSDLTDEVEKAKRLVNAGRCDCYVLLTNAGVTGARVEEIEVLFLAAGVKQVVVYGAT